MAGATFCSACGTRLSSSCPALPVPSRDDTPAAIERRQITVIFCELVGSTALSERLQPEEFRDVLRAFQRTAREAVQHYDGHIAQYLSDGVMAYFGYPRAHEDDPVRALRAALRLRDDAPLLNDGIGKRLNVRVHVRVGLHTGIVVVGEIGPGGQHDRLAVGDTMNVAARVQSVATVDTVLASAATARLGEGYVQLRSRGLKTLKGISTPFEVFEVLGAVRGLTPFVGRAQELGRLERLWRECRLGDQRAVLVRGEAGIGKSRLVDSFRKLALEDPSALLQCHCRELTQGTAMAPVIDSIERLLDRDTGTTNPIDRLAALKAALGEHSRLGEDALPLLASLLSLPDVDETPIAGMSPPQRWTRTLAVLRTWFTYAAERVPRLLLFEDLHWADPLTLEYVSLLVRHGGGPRTLICCTARPEFQCPWPVERITCLDLQRLERPEAETLVKRVAGGHGLPPQVMFQIVDRSEGVPLFVEEITRALLDSGALVDRGDRYEFPDEEREAIVPTAVADSMVSRFERLGASRPIAQLAAAIGREFNSALLLATSGLSEKELRQHLDTLCASGLVLPQGEEPTPFYLFKHALLHEAVYGTLLKKDRREAHARIFAELKSGFAGWLAAHPEAGAFHAEEAGLRKEALEYRKTAGLLALARMEAHGAVRHLTRAIDLLDALEEPDRSRGELELLGRLMQAYTIAYGYASANLERACERMLVLARHQGDRTSEVLALRGLISAPATPTS
jgi:class 3 adenylate cyclase